MDTDKPAERGQRDTLMDLASYALMTIRAIEEERGTMNATKR